MCLINVLLYGLSPASTWCTASKVPSIRGWPCVLKMCSRNVYACAHMVAHLHPLRLTGEIEGSALMHHELEQVKIKIAIARRYLSYC